MAPCCQNVVTPRMIKAGQVAVGDKIQLEEESVKASASAPEEESIPVQTQAMEQIARNEMVRDEMAQEQMARQQAQGQGSMQPGQQTAIPGIIGIPGGAITEDARGQRQILPFDQMTSYMDNVSLGGTMDNPSVRVPQNPLTPNGFQEEIDSSALQSFNGFLRTQIGRYVRVEQLVTSDRTEDRLGFLVGVGSNFIILQDISTGNIMVIDIFSIRLTYVYYSSAVVPAF